MVGEETSLSLSPPCSCAFLVTYGIGDGGGRAGAGGIWDGGCAGDSDRGLRETHRLLPPKFRNKFHGRRRRRERRPSLILKDSLSLSLSLSLSILPSPLSREGDDATPPSPVCLQCTWLFASVFFIDVVGVNTYPSRHGNHVGMNECRRALFCPKVSPCLRPRKFDAARPAEEKRKEG